MKILIDSITEEVTKAFVDNGYDAKYGKVTLSNRPDLCEYQCNGAMAAAKEYKCAPFMISDKIAEALTGNAMFESVESVKPGFINLKLSKEYLAGVVTEMKQDEGRFGCEAAKNPKIIIVDYGGANVAKPLHVGHLRSTVIGGALYNIYKYLGYNVTGINHLGDYGTQFGKLIEGYKRWGSEYNIDENPIDELTKIYIRINNACKEDPNTCQAIFGTTNITKMKAY